MVVGGDVFTALLNGHIEVDADQHPLATYLRVLEASLSHDSPQVLLLR
jgi:hypothetical protein